ncbi:MAG: helix-turn-helix transcriptional regulator [Bryobacteraceae bacterium]|jgi:transcriptional regulator with XRE-family HTH domain
MVKKLSKAAKELRKRLGQSQQAFASGLGISIRSIANYEAGREPTGKPLFALTMAAQEAGHMDLANVFSDAMSEELKGWPFTLFVNPETDSHPINGHLLASLQGFEQLLAAGCFLEVVKALGSTDAHIRLRATVIDATEALVVAAEDLGGKAKVEKLRRWLREAGGKDPLMADSTRFEITRNEDGIKLKVKPK